LRALGGEFIPRIPFKSGGSSRSPPGLLLPDVEICLRAIQEVGAHARPLVRGRRAAYLDALVGRKFADAGLRNAKVSVTGTMLQSKPGNMITIDAGKWDSKQSHPGRTDRGRASPTCPIRQRDPRQIRYGHHS